MVTETVLPVTGKQYPSNIVYSLLRGSPIRLKKSAVMPCSSIQVCSPAVTRASPLSRTTSSGSSPSAPPSADTRRGTSAGRTEPVLVLLAQRVAEVLPVDEQRSIRLAGCRHRERASGPQRYGLLGGHGPTFPETMKRIGQLGARWIAGRYRAILAHSWWECSERTRPIPTARGSWRG